MLTLCTMGLLEEVADMGADVTGGFDGLDSLPIKGRFRHLRVRPAPFPHAILYVLGVLLICFVFVRTLVYSPFGRTASTDSARTRCACMRSALVRMRLDRLLHHLGGDRGHCRRAVGHAYDLEPCSGSTAPRRC